MIRKPEKIHYSRNFEIALIISLSIVILLFTFFPNNLGKGKTSNNNNSIIFSVNDIPPTVQTSGTRQAIQHIPRVPDILIPSDIEPPEVLKDVEISGNNLTVPRASGNGTSNKNNAASSPPFVPRQILEVMPKKVDQKVDGYIKLSLKIGTDGKVKSYIVLTNTTNCSQCLKNVLNAVLKSRWQPATVNGNKIDYWVEKSYNFN